jgi:hypothetical protein
MSRFRRAFTRAKYAAIGAAIGGAVGGLFSRNAASTLGGIGALVGAVMGEKRVDIGSMVEDVTDRDREVNLLSRGKADQETAD